MGLIPDDIIDEIRGRADLVAIIGRHVKLSKSGRSFKGLCPFHNERSPSFHVHPDKGFYYCFGCQAKGDAFSFLKDYEGKSFAEAAETLAAELGIAIPQTATSAGAPRSRRRELLDVNRVAADFYRGCLARSDVARRYLRERGIGDEIAATFELGYAPDAWSELGDHLRKMGQSAEIAESVGLTVPRKNSSGTYDRFRDRLMCPIHLAAGEVAGFSGRIVNPDADKQTAKYINSPESAVYKKSKLLFGLHQARAGLREKGRAVLVEGNFDVISLHQAGLTETVAPLGTALTDEQVDQLRRLSETVVLLYDGDRAGRMAAYKALLPLVEAGIEVRIAVLDEGDDPDSAVKQKGGQYLMDCVGSAQPALEYFIYDVWGKGGSQSAQRQARALEAAAELIRRLPTPEIKNLFAGKLASALGIELDAVRRAVRGGGGQAAPERHAAEPPPVRPSSMPPRHELDFLAILADHPQLIETAEEIDVFSLLTDERLRDMYSAARAGQPLVAALPGPEGADPMAAHIAKYVLAGSYGSLADPAQTLRGMATNLLQVRKRAKLESLQKEADEAARRGDVALQRKIFREIVETRK